MAERERDQMGAPAGWTIPVFCVPWSGTFDHRVRRPALSSHRPHRTLGLHHALIALALIAALSGFTAGQDKSPAAKPVPEPAAAKVADPMASFARMMPGMWRRTVLSGTSTFDSWHWGPGRHSMRVMTDGLDAAGRPWRELQVLYWHPGRKQVCLLSLHPDVPGIGPGVGEGTIRFEGETAVAAYDLYQRRGRRKMGLRWAFDGPDKYHATLLEATGTAGFKPLVEWDYVRVKTRPRGAEAAPKPSEHLKVLEPLLGRTWEAKGDGAAGDAFQIRSTFEWVPYADYVYARVLAPGKDGGLPHLLDAYLYHHTGTGALRCLALSERGGVYEVDLTVLDAGALQLDLKGYEDDRGVPHVVRFDFERDWTLRHRVWSLKGPEHTLLLDVHHKQLEPKRD